jgi:hypothetical protein
MKKGLITILLVVLIHFIHGQKNEYIIIKHIGVQNRATMPLTVILSGSKSYKLDDKILIYEKYKCAENFICLIDSDSYHSYSKLVFNRKDSLKVKNMNKGLPDFGSFKISVYKNNKKLLSYSIYSKDESIDFFNRLSKGLDSKFSNDVIKLKYYLCDEVGVLSGKKPNCNQYKWW